MMTVSPMRRAKARKTSALRALCSASITRAHAIPIDSAASLAYLNRNRTPHASASVCAPGGSFFAQNMGKAGFQ